MQLEDFANRIPSLTFEVEADEGAVAIGAVAEELSNGAIAAGETPAVAGYAATGDSVRSAVGGLADIVPLSLADESARLVLRRPGGTALTIAREATTGHPEILRKAASAVPAEASLAHYDPARDYQTGYQRAGRGGPALRSDRRSVAAALSSEAAKGFAEQRLAALWAGRTTARVETGWREISVRPGMLASIEGEAGSWKVDRWLLGRMKLSLEPTRVGDGAGAPAPASGGRSVAEPDLVHGPTVLRLVDAPLPVQSDGLWLFGAAAGPSAGWRRAGLAPSRVGGASWSDIGQTARPAVIGATLTPLADRGAALVDEIETVDVELLNEDMVLEGRSLQALSAAANFALIGSERVQFGSVEAIGPRRFRLGRLLRGRRGTEWAATHAAGDDFLLIEEEAVLPIAAPAGAIGSEARLLAAGIGDAPAGVEAWCLVAGETLRPPAPVHLAAAAAGAAILIRWVRRSRGGWDWSGGSDAPLAEERERYLLTLSGSGAIRSFELSEPSFLYTAQAQGADGIAPPLTISVQQIGTYAVSRAAHLVFG